MSLLDASIGLSMIMDGTKERKLEALTHGNAMTMAGNSSSVYISYAPVTGVLHVVRILRQLIRWFQG